MLDIWYATLGSYVGAIATDDKLIKTVVKTVRPGAVIVSPQAERQG